MAERINIQDAFLNYMRKNRVPVTVFLMNGVKLTGTVSCFDQSAIVIRREGYMQMVYKHAISTFSPHGAVSVFDWNGAPQSGRSPEDVGQVEPSAGLGENPSEDGF
ncbi:MAG: RNA chaperone Hfq [Alphaproteobacteria bacterium]|nr:RNA chaperone Hfq [Alphaproteobacteria bacterium]